jgi:hypothetical protein
MSLKALSEDDIERAVAKMSNERLTAELQLHQDLAFNAVFTPDDAEDDFMTILAAAFSTGRLEVVSAPKGEE